MNTIPITVPPSPNEDDWGATIHYADTHAGEIDAIPQDGLPLTDQEVDALAEDHKRREPPKRPRSPLFEMFADMARAQAEFYRENPLR